MTGSEKRKFIRYDSLHLLNYLVLDSDGNAGTYSMGRTIDVSVDGLKLETFQELQPNTRLHITIGIDDNLIDLEGLTTHTSKNEDRFVSGITFVKVSKNGRRVFARYVEEFRKRVSL